MEENKIPYKLLQEKYVSNLNGTTCVETLLAVTPNYFSVLILSIIGVSGDSNLTRYRDFLIEYIVIASTGILSCTIFSNYLLHVAVSLFILCVGFYTYIIYHTKINCQFEDFMKFSVTTKHRCFVTNFRALIIMLTCIGILAVDFSIFPRRFAKTEFFGYSPMDTGVGLFCISNSVVVPFMANRKESVRLSFWSALAKTFKNCIPLIVLGGIRFLATKQVDYHVHISEYGVHWNFFLTLAVAKLVTFVLSQIIDVKFSFILSFIVIILYEILLINGLQNWVFSNIPRINFITANREGIVSSIGYVALFLAGTGIGNMIYIVPNSIQGSVLLIRKFIILSIILWMFTFMSQNIFIASRRLANFGYFIWILTFSCTTLTFYILVDLILQALKYFTFLKRCKKALVGSEGQVPVLFESFNFNGLAIFLISNILTGFINISIETLKVSNINSLIILFLYTFITYFISYVLYRKKIRLKVW